MCRSRSNNIKTDKRLERCIRIIDHDKQSSFRKLLEKDNCISTHQQNLEILADEM